MDTGDSIPTWVLTRPLAATPSHPAICNPAGPDIVGSCFYVLDVKKIGNFFRVGLTPVRGWDAGSPMVRCSLALVEEVWNLVQSRRQ